MKELAIHILIQLGLGVLVLFWMLFLNWIGRIFYDHENDIDGWPIFSLGVTIWVLISIIYWNL